jgi:4-hydroxybenzoate polyprenyltransferase
LNYINLLRVKQWAKNLFLFIPLFFAGELFDLNKIIQTGLGFVAFSLVASSIYILNDYRDIEADQAHPEKSKRPLASGAVQKSTAISILFICAIAGVSLAYMLNTKFLFIVCIYFIMNLFYSFGLKHISILDIMIIAVGFVLRVKAGGAVTDTYVTQWLTIMVFLLALFMAIAKRRDDILLAMRTHKEVRKSAKSYNLDFISACLALISAVAIVAYIMYTISPEVANRFDTHRLYYTSLFVIAGIFRYLQLAYVQNDTGSPTEVLYKDKFIQITILLWIASFYFIIYFPNIQMI